MQRRSTRTYLALLVLGALALPVAALTLREDPPKTEETAEARKERKIRRLLVATNSREVMEKSTAVGAEAFAKMGLPDTFTEAFVDRFDYERMIDATVGVYMEEVEEETVDALIAFHESEQGKIFAAQLPEITVQTIRLGQKYGEELATDIANGK